MVTRSDLRARLSPRGTVRGGSSGYSLPFQGPGNELQRTNGIQFPFTPNITVAHAVEYSQYDLVHTNYQQNAYSKTRNPMIQVMGTFISQTPEEARYTVGVMHFLRVMSKMNFGAEDDDAGTPPPVLEFSAYGAYNFNRIPVLIGSFNFAYDDNTDYVEVVTAGEAVQIPILMAIAIDLLPQYSPAMQNRFNINDLARGDAYRASNGGFI